MMTVSVWAWMPGIHFSPYVPSIKSYEPNSWFYSGVLLLCSYQEINSPVPAIKAIIYHFLYKIVLNLIYQAQVLMSPPIKWDFSVPY